MSCRFFAAMVTLLDKQVGELIRTIDESGLGSNTLIFLHPITDLIWKVARIRLLTVMVLSPSYKRDPYRRGHTGPYDCSVDWHH